MQVGFKQTGRSCSTEGCIGRLKDNILDWDSALPDDELDASQDHLDAADAVICLGTSLQINPAGKLPLRIKRGKRRGKSIVTWPEDAPLYPSKGMTPLSLKSLCIFFRKSFSSGRPLGSATLCLTILEFGCRMA